MEIKKCSKCGIIKDINEFGVETRRSDGRRCACKKCLKPISDKWEKNNKEKRNQQRKEYELRNISKRKEQWKQKNKRLREKYRQIEKEKYNNDIEYRKKKIFNACKYSKTEIGKINKLNYWNIRKRLKEETFDGTINKNSLNELIKKQNYNCTHCGVNLNNVKKHLDHIIPLSKGGKHTIDNVQYLCIHCNCSKGNKFIG